MLVKIRRCLARRPKMGLSYLREAIERPEVIRKIVRSYNGAYSLGITRLPGSDDEFAFLLRVEDENPTGLPHEVTVNGHKIQVIVKGGFRRPVALKQR